MTRRRIEYQSGDATVILDDVASDLLRQALDTNHVVRALDAELDEHEDRIASEWPVKTGNSKAAFVRRLRVSRTTVSAALVNEIPYAYFVRGKQQDGRRSWVELVEKPAKAGTSDLVARCQREWAAAHGGP